MGRTECETYLERARATLEKGSMRLNESKELVIVLTLKESEINPLFDITMALKLYGCERALLEQFDKDYRHVRRSE